MARPGDSLAARPHDAANDHHHRLGVWPATGAGCLGSPKKFAGVSAARAPLMEQCMLAPGKFLRLNLPPAQGRVPSDDLG